MIQLLDVDQSGDLISIEAQFTLFADVYTEKYFSKLESHLSALHETQRLLNLIVHGLTHLEERIQEDLPCFGIFTQFTGQERNYWCVQYHLRRLRMEIEKPVKPLTF